MSRGTKIILLVAAAAIAIGLILFFVIWPLFNGSQGPAAVNLNANLNAGGLTNAAPVANTNSAPTVPPPAKVTDQTQQVSAARSVARTFAERLASFTNQNGLANLADLQALSTPVMWKYLDGEYRAGLTKNLPPAKDYYGVLATAMSVNLTPIAADQVSGSIQLQKVESGTVNQTTYQVLDIKLKNVDGAWLVSWLQWGK